VAERAGFLRNNAFLVAAVVLPLLVVAFFLLASAIPRWTVAPPAHDLLLRVGKPYGGKFPHVGVEFKVRGGQLEASVRPVPRDRYEQPWALFVFDHQTLNLREVPLNLPESPPEDSPTQTIVVDLAGRRILEQAKAPDGYELRRDRSRGSGLVGDLFGMRGYDRSVALVNKGRVIAIPLPSGYEYLSPVDAIGWLTDTPQSRLP
jgi:hypothetical protein